MAEKVGALKQQINDPAFPHITYRKGASGAPFPVLRGTGIRVQTLVVATQTWGLTPARVAAEYDLTPMQVQEALAFYAAHRDEIDAALMAEEVLEAGAHGPTAPAS